MTYGLNACTVILMILFTKDTNTQYSIIFGHHTIKSNILEWFTRYYTEDYNINIYLLYQLLY